MNSIPDTRASLIIRLPDAADLEAWREFAEIYEPFVYRFARRRGLQDADAREVVQEVFLGVSRAVRDWKPDQGRARFRTWLFRIAKNQLLRLLNRRRRESLMLGTDPPADIGEALEATAEAELEEQQAYRQEVFRWASQRVRSTVRPANWDAFWATSVLGRSADQVAASLGISRGAVYVARSRVIKKLREEVVRFENEAM